jgi:peptidoglycan/xylan/chitin deacetylase (PgdA/CDA1 family)
MSAINIIMYHYVRPIKNSAYPKLKGLELSGFKRQLDFLSSKYEFITAEDVINAVKFKKKLKDNCCWLTFDDGYKDHYTYVLPELLKRKIQGSFFPTIKATVERAMMNFNAVHYILASADNINDLVIDLNDQSRNFGFTDDDLKKLWDKYAMPSRYDPKEVMYIKRLLQNALPEDIRNKISSYLFEKYVGADQVAFAEQLYMSEAEVKELINSGMYVGNHGYQHLHLNKEDTISQKTDIDLGIKFLSSIGARTEDWIMCFPYGKYNHETIEILSRAKCAVALTTEPARAELSVHHPLQFPRFDTNDFPQ